MPRIDLGSYRLPVPGRVRLRYVELHRVIPGDDVACLSSEYSISLTSRVPLLAGPRSRRLRAIHALTLALTLALDLTLTLILIIASPSRAWRLPIPLLHSHP